MPRALELLAAVTACLVLSAGKQCLTGFGPGWGVTQKVRQLLKSFTHQKQLVVDRVEPIADSEGETKGYMVFAKP